MKQDKRCETCINKDQFGNDFCRVCENEKKLAKAEADAKAKIMEAEAEKQANELLEKSLTPQILQEMYLDKWDGKLPQVVADGEMIMQIPEMATAN